MDKRIASIFKEDGSGWWIELKPGFILRHEWTHAIVEDTKKAALAQMSQVEPCDCKECAAMMVKP